MRERRATLAALLVTAACASSCTLLLGRFEEAGAGGGGSTSSSASASSAASSGTTSTGCDTPPCCVKDTDCGAAPPCMAVACVSGACVTAPSPMGASAPDPSRDCRKLVCDGSGGTLVVDDDTDLPDDGNPCTKDGCFQGAPTFQPVAGSCPGSDVCGPLDGLHAGTCVPPECADGLLTPPETDIDCGGPSCPPCGYGSQCAADTDCASGYCLPSGLCGPQVVATQISTPAQLALDGASVYWTALGTSTTTGAIGAVPKSGGAPSVIAAAQITPAGIAVAGSRVYWSNRGIAGSDGTLAWAPVTGGPVTLLATGLSQPGAVAVNSAHVYCATSVGLVRVAVNGGGPMELVVPGTAVLGVAVDEASAYATTGTQILRVNLATLEATTFVGGSIGPTVIAVDAKNAYWIEPTQNRVMQASLAGGTPISLAAMSGMLAPAGVLAVSDSDVYFAVSMGNQTASLVKVPIGVAHSTPKLVADAITIRGLAVDEQHVYWSSASTVRRALR